MSDKIIQSYVFHEGKAWFVSTIMRDYDTHCGVVHGPETMAWEWDPATKERGGKIIYHTDEGFAGHERVCHSLAMTGKIEDDFQA